MAWGPGWGGAQGCEPVVLAEQRRLEGSLGVWALEDELGMGRADLGRGKRKLTRLASSVLSPGSPHDIRGGRGGGGLRLGRQGASRD